MREKCRLEQGYFHNKIQYLVYGWGRSADRSRLRAISLQTGNFSGNFAIFPLREDINDENSLCRRRLFADSLIKRTGKKPFENREFPIKQQHRLQHEPFRQCLGQCGDGELLLLAQDRTD